MIDFIKIKLKPHNQFYMLEEPAVLYSVNVDTIAASCLKPAEYDEVITMTNVIANVSADVDLERKEITMMNENDIHTQPLTKVESIKLGDIITMELGLNEHINTARKIEQTAMNLLGQTINTVYGVSIKTSIILRELKVEYGKVTDLRVNKYSRVYLYLRKPGYMRRCEPQLVLEGYKVRFLGVDTDLLQVSLRGKESEYEEKLEKLMETTRNVIRLVNTADINDSDHDYKSVVESVLSDLESAIMQFVETSVAYRVNGGWDVVAGEQKK